MNTLWVDGFPKQNQSKKAVLQTQETWFKNTQNIKCQERRKKSLTFKKFKQSSYKFPLVTNEYCTLRWVYVAQKKYTMVCGQ